MNRKKMISQMNNRKLRNRILTGIAVLGIAGLLLWKQPTYAAWQQQEDGSVYYADENGQIVTGFQEIDGERYYFDSNGYLQTGKFYVKDQDAYYYSNKKGILATEGVVSTKNGFYVVDADGKIQTGFIDQDGARYYFDSTATMVKGWYKAEDNWYYADENGRMCTGLVTIDGYRYYLGTDGVRVSNTVMELDGATYVFNEDGSVDENATALYPVYQNINAVRVQNSYAELRQDVKVQACAIVRAGTLKDGFEATPEGTLENLLKNRGVACNNGYEFSYGGVANYGIDRLIQDMNQDSRLQQALQDESVTAVGIGMNQQGDMFYYDIILISE